MRAHPLATPRHLSRGLLCALLLWSGALASACGGDVRPPDEGSPQDEDLHHSADQGGLDMGADQSGEVDLGADQGALSGLPSGLVYEQFIFRETFLNCHSTICTRELQFALRGGNIHRIEYGMSAGVKPLMDDEYEALMALVDTPETMRHMRDGWRCAAPPHDVQRTRHVSFQLSYWMDGQHYTLRQTVTDCFDNDAEDKADGLIDLSRALRLRYYEQL